MIAFQYIVSFRAISSPSLPEMRVVCCPEHLAQARKSGTYSGSLWPGQLWVLFLIFKGYFRTFPEKITPTF
jgi:hypothetical protein